MCSKLQLSTGNPTSPETMSSTSLITCCERIQDLVVQVVFYRGATTMSLRDGGHCPGSNKFTVYMAKEEE